MHVSKDLMWWRESKKTCNLNKALVYYHILQALFDSNKLGDLSQVTENQWLISHAYLVVDDL